MQEKVMGYRRNYRRKNSASEIIRDVGIIGSKVGWQGALLLGALSFVIFYFVLPAWIVSILQEQQNNRFYPMLEALFSRRLHWLQWIGVTTGLIGLYFGIRNYYFVNSAASEERSLVTFIAKLIGRKID